MSAILEVFSTDPVAVFLLGFIAGAFSRYPRAVLQLAMDVVTKRLNGRQTPLELKP